MKKQPTTQSDLPNTVEDLRDMILRLQHTNQIKDERINNMNNTINDLQKSYDSIRTQHKDDTAYYKTDVDYYKNQISQHLTEINNYKDIIDQRPIENVELKTKLNEKSHNLNLLQKKYHDLKVIAHKSIDKNKALKEMVGELKQDKIDLRKAIKVLEEKAQGSHIESFDNNDNLSVNITDTPAFKKIGAKYEEEKEGENLPLRMKAFSDICFVHSELVSEAIPVTGDSTVLDISNLTLEPSLLGDS